MVHGSIGGTGSTGELSCSNDFGSTLLDGGKEALLDPLVINCISNSLTIESGLIEIGNHCWAMVSEDGELLDVIEVASHFI